VAVALRGCVAPLDAAPTSRSATGATTLCNCQSHEVHSGRPRNDGVLECVRQSATPTRLWFCVKGQIFQELWAARLVFQGENERVPHEKPRATFCCTCNKRLSLPIRRAERSATGDGHSRALTTAAKSEQLGIMKTISSMRWQPSMAGLLFGTLCLAPSAVQAHVLPGAVGGLGAGLAHPLQGMDHLLAMVAVGLLGAQIGGRALWILPAVFVGVMSVGAVAGGAGMALPLVEPMILLSVLVLGGLLVSARAAGVGVTAALVGALALFHGHAHGTELATAGSSVLVGMVASTAALHGVGLALGLGARALARHQWIRLAGGGIAACGLMLGLSLL
jgi:urease accessory protein